MTRDDILYRALLEETAKAVLLALDRSTDADVQHAIEPIRRRLTQLNIDRNPTP